ncbi:DUF1318 domain-containing protein [Aquisediminimonas sediminicola]|uniref:DUF1318 domain-containing protein n=1 Tax=Alteraquisediminimonas sediminicola TaxID=2676787 RepID=UPI001C8ED852|nr:DUF1318 domain-containing protein [Aquisediminimonas sediminicola]
MDRNKTLLTKSLLAGALSLSLAGGAIMASAQGVSAIETAKSQGVIGETWEGYIDFAKTPSDAVRDEVEALNIKRRAAYTQLASQRGATVQEVALKTACQIFAAKIQVGQAYLLPDKIWRVREGASPIARPDYCN